MMKRKKIITAVVLTGSIGLGAHPLFAQAGPGGTAGGSGGAAQSGPTITQPGPSSPGQTQPTIPGQPAPRSPSQSDQVLPGGQKTPGITGQAEGQVPGQTRTPGLAGPTDRVIPGQQGTIPEVVGRPESAAGDNRSATASREDVRKAQEALKAQGHNVGSFDGNMDNRTQQALRDFQQANKLPVTGILDQQTAAKLGIRLDSGSATPQRGQDSVAPQGSEAIPGKRPAQ